MPFCRISRFRLTATQSVLLLLMLGLGASSASAQTVTALLENPATKLATPELKAAEAPVPKPDAPPAIVPVKPVKPAGPAHKFFDLKNSLLLTTSAAALVGDSLSTQRALPYGHEVNPIARPFVQTRAGAAAYSIGGYGALVGGMYFAHRKGWHRLEWIVPTVFTVSEGLLTYNNSKVVR